MLLGGFYRHLYEQKLGSDKDDTEKIKENLISNETKSENTKTDKLETTKKRNYRKRKTSSDIKKQLSDGEIEDSDEEIKHLNLKDISLAKKSKHSDVNIDADSDFSIDESSDDETNDKKKKVDAKQTAEDELKSATTDGTKQSIEADIMKAEKDETIKEKQEAVEPKPKIDIWKKRTVGEVFAQALKRYYERKAARSM